jgi:hypothetical protein
MLTLIEPQSHHLHQETIDSFLDLLYQHHGLRFSPELLDKATFVIGNCKTFSPSGKTPGKEIYGGAILYPQKISHRFDLSVHDRPEMTLGKLFSAFQPNGKTYWIARIGLFRDHDLSVPLLEKLERRHQFYQQLYKAFFKFGRKQKVKVLAFTLRVFDIFDIDTYKYWPSLLEVKLPDSSHGYFYGLLPLKKHSFKPRKLENMLSSFQPFAEENLKQLAIDVEATGRAL